MVHDGYGEEQDFQQMIPGAGVTMKKEMMACVLILFSAVYANSVFAMGSSPKQKVGKQADLSSTFTSTEYHWFDGDKQRKVYLSSDMLVEFQPSDVSKDALKSVFPQAKSVPGKRGAVRLWKLEQSVASGKNIQSLKELNPDGKFSPVLHDGPGGTGGIRALPGNIIVQLDASMKSTDIDQWLVKTGSVMVKKLAIGSNIIVLQSAPGLASLSKANDLYQDKDVISAQPNWWRPYSLK